MPELSCREFIGFLDDYLDDTLEVEARARFEGHLGECPYCVDYLKTYRDTIRLARLACREDGSLPPPADVPEDLVQAILKSREPG